MRRRISAFFADLRKARMFFYSMRPEDRAAAQYAVGVRNVEAVKFEPSFADVMTGPHSDLDPDDEDYESELDYRLVWLYQAHNKQGAGIEVSPRELEALDRFRRFIPRLRR